MLQLGVPFFVRVPFEHLNAKFFEIGIGRGSGCAETLSRAVHITGFRASKGIGICVKFTLGGSVTNIWKNWGGGNLHVQLSVDSLASTEASQVGAGKRQTETEGHMKLRWFAQASNQRRTTADEWGFVGRTRYSRSSKI